VARLAAAYDPQDVLDLWRGDVEAAGQTCVESDDEDGRGDCVGRRPTAAELEDVRYAMLEVDMRSGDYGEDAARPNAAECSALRLTPIRELVIWLCRHCVEGLLLLVQHDYANLGPGLFPVCESCPPDARFRRSLLSIAAMDACAPEAVAALVEIGADPNQITNTTNRGAHTAQDMAVHMQQRFKRGLPALTHRLEQRQSREAEAAKRRAREREKRDRFWLRNGVTPSRLHEDSGVDAWDDALGVVDEVLRSRSVLECECALSGCAAGSEIEARCKQHLSRARAAARARWRVLAHVVSGVRFLRHLAASPGSRAALRAERSFCACASVMCAAQAVDAWQRGVKRARR
jgi:hypothetical protein